MARESLSKCPSLPPGLTGSGLHSTCNKLGFSACRIWRRHGLPDWGGAEMADTSATATLGGWRAITGYQWLVFLVVWAGWTLDAADFGLFALVLRPALINLLGFPTTGALDPAQAAQIGKDGGLLLMTGLLGWAGGGGRLGGF